MGRKSAGAVPSKKESKEDVLAREVARAVGAGRPVKVETVDFSDPDRPKTCLEVDFPILPINQVAIIEGNAGKPIYQVSKWWARRRSSVFRSLLLAAAMKAPENEGEADKAVWDVYYANHQKEGALAHLKVADIFMGGGTTIVEGSRLGMQMTGVDLNPVAWFIVKNELAQVERGEVEALLADVEAAVKPQIMPFYATDCPRGHKGTWTTTKGAAVTSGFDPLALVPEDRRAYSYAGPEIIYVFWVKHGPCQMRGCSHRTPLLPSPVIAIKTMTVKAWEWRCRSCSRHFDIEEDDVRMAPGVSLIAVDTDTPYARIQRTHARGAKTRRVDVTCPACKVLNDEVLLADPAGRRKKVDLTLLIHPIWMAGEAGIGADGQELGGSNLDSAAATAAWNRARASKLRLLEVRGTLPGVVTCPETGAEIKTGDRGGTITGSGKFRCGSCGVEQRVVEAIGATGKTAPVAPMAVQGYCPACDEQGEAYNGRFFGAIRDIRPFNAASLEWRTRSEGDLASYWPRSEIPFGHMTHQRQPLPQHGYLRWADMFNDRQMLVHALLLRAVATAGGEAHRWDAREYVLTAFQQYLRNQNMFCFWDISRDCMAPHLSNANFHPKSVVIENSVFGPLGRGNWLSSAESLIDALTWAHSPWEVVPRARLEAEHFKLVSSITGTSAHTATRDPVRPADAFHCTSSTELSGIASQSLDLVVTDPPFGGLLHYSELSDFFYVWLRLVLRQHYPDYFSGEYVPKTLEAVANPARNPDDPDAFYRRLLTGAWQEAHRILKPGGILAFTFHHSEDAPWVDVLESLFQADFYLEATYPIRSDETKGTGEFGSKTIEYDIIHVCRKRREAPTATSWARMRREVVREVKQLKALLEHHHQAGLPDADLQVIRRGKALEYYSRHYGKVFTTEGNELGVAEALAGINQILDEESGAVTDPPPAEADPFTRQFLRLFDRRTEMARDQVQKFLKGTGIAPSDYENRGWCREDKKIYHLIPPLEIARRWHGKPKDQIVHDYDQAAVLIGACVENSGIVAADLLRRTSFKPHPALGPLLAWFAERASTIELRQAAGRAQRLLQAAQVRQAPPIERQVQMPLPRREESS